MGTIVLAYIQTSWGVGILNSAIFNSFHNQVEFGTILEGLQNFRGGFEPPKSPGTPLPLCSMWLASVLRQMLRWSVTCAYGHLTQMFYLYQGTSLGVLERESAGSDVSRVLCQSWLHGSVVCSVCHVYFKVGIKFWHQNVCYLVLFKCNPSFKYLFQLCC